jgi:hypothetical protein
LSQTYGGRRTYGFTLSLPKLHPLFIARARASRQDVTFPRSEKSKKSKGDGMKTSLRKLIVAVGVILMGTILTAKASAECVSLNSPKALKPQSWEGNELFQQGSLLLASDNDDPIVGMWQVKFTAEGNTGSMAPPDGTPIDNAFVQWHSDGTEIMNSGRPAQDGNFCLGVWKRTGKTSYKLNHFALGNDTENAPSGIGNPLGPTQIRENIVLSRDGNSYSGSFTLDAYNTSGANVAHIVGKVSATRITVNTAASSVM